MPMSLLFERTVLLSVIIVQKGRHINLLGLYVVILDDQYFNNSLHAQLSYHLLLFAGQEDYDRLRPLSYPQTVSLCSVRLLFKYLTRDGNWSTCRGKSEIWSACNLPWWSL